MDILIGRKQKGFTIIEVLIVLAIAGLILVVVFLAVPQLQKNTRDNARQAVVTRLSAEIETYAANNQGSYPFKEPGTGSGTIEDFKSRYYSTIAKKNPSTGGDYLIAFAAADDDNPTADQLLIHRGANCKGESAIGTSSSPSALKYAIRISLDRPGTYFCLDKG